MTTLAERLKRAGVAQAQIAEALGLSGAEVCRQVNGLRPLDPRVEAACLHLIDQAATEQVARAHEETTAAAGRLEALD
jgi:predicted transcriptional regulator